MLIATHPTGISDAGHIEMWVSDADFMVASIFPDCASLELAGTTQTLGLSKPCLGSVKRQRNLSHQPVDRRSARSRDAAPGH